VKQPELVGFCWSQGKTRDEALDNIREAIDLFLDPEDALSSVY
jgi:predicted RNase H-like HicB family nuclease